ncbi:hypothetical protein [Granulicella sp. S156]|uniref:hypothetical protein n=1 Tax=Granulicella sp. S156 TaxID=1747224 RepID=UPI00131BF285|nr:hypothetical protein [Granulicella sp. S156]
MKVLKKLLLSGAALLVWTSVAMAQHNGSYRDFDSKSGLANAVDTTANTSSVGGWNILAVASDSVWETQTTNEVTSCNVAPDDSCTLTVYWPVSFANLSYSAACTISGTEGSNFTVSYTLYTGKTESSQTVIFYISDQFLNEQAFVNFSCTATGDV